MNAAYDFARVGRCRASRLDARPLLLSATRCAGDFAAATPTTIAIANSPPPSIQSAVAPPPGMVDRTRTAVTETGTTLRDGFEAGIDAANQQLSRAATR